MAGYIVNDIKVTEDVFMKKRKFFLMSDSRGKYMRLTEPQYRFFSAVIPLLLETDDEDELSRRLMEETDGNVGLEQIKTVFGKYNLLSASCEERKGTVEAEFTSNKVCEIPLGRIQRKAGKFFSFLFMMLTVSFVLLAVFTAAGVAVRAYSGERLIQLRELTSYGMFLEMDLLIILPGLAMCIIGHELGHLLTAHKAGIEWKSITFALRWGISAVYYVKYRDFYNNSSRNKLAVILAGVTMNLLMSMIYIILDWYMPRTEFEILIFINLIGIFKNIMPSGTSDGYLACCIITGMEGIRWKMLKRISLILNNPREIMTVLRDRESRFLIMYFAASYSVSIFGFYRIIRSMLGMLTANGDPLSSAGIIAAVAALVIFGFIGNIIKLYKKVKRM